MGRSVTRQEALETLLQSLNNHATAYEGLKAARQELSALEKQFIKTETHALALQTVGQTIGEILKQLTPEKFIIKSSAGPRYVVGIRKQAQEMINALKKKQQIFQCGRIKSDIRHNNTDNHAYFTA
ncbi:hypothetical protein EDEG_01039 [Edhazardia aedis USNM 41457]|uniref:Uncharacterized protein n=1 Tax=Edhazardia aedis (strain USNM 41457) TaxID=1003232 RepID=J9DB80_EDHAE|nr:hypothetical protein EDEG_01039 [Edhazardia aedis USNM 41457]|eukprot:EJW04749.1 hypothetical protein EDEG_01039 [Edhazardia aedis USNM 41457]